jgi:DNA-binding transcriptional LysR family regulator
MDFRSLEAFAWVAELGGFRRAAEKLHLTQPAISARIAQLEAEFGVQLLERSSRSVTLTARGRQLLDYAERALRLRDEMRITLSEPGALFGLLRIGVAETIVNTWLPRLMDRIHVEHPRLAVEIDVDISPHLRDRLIAREFDLALLLGPVVEPAVRNRPLCRVPVRFLASPRFELPPPPVPLAALAAHPLITFSRRTQPHVALRELFAQAKLPLARLHASASLAPVVRMAVDGVGIAFIPPVVARGEIRAGALRVVDTPAAIPDLSFTASWIAQPDDHAAEAVAGIAAEVAARAA